MNKKKIEKE